MRHPGPAGPAHWAATADLFKCLSAPLRVGIIELLVQRPHTVSDLVEALDAPQPLISQHLRVLRDRCLVEGRRTGRATSYSLVDDHVAHIVCDALQHASEHDPGAARATHANRKEAS